MNNVIVQVRLKKECVLMLEDISAELGVERTQVINSGITMFNKIVDEISDGSKVYIERKDGTRHEITVFR